MKSNDIVVVYFNHDKKSKEKFLSNIGQPWTGVLETLFYNQFGDSAYDVYCKNYGILSYQGNKYILDVNSKMSSDYDYEIISVIPDVDKFIDENKNNIIRTIRL